MSAAAVAGVALVVAVAGAVQLAAGFGFGLAAVPLLSVVLDPHDAVIVALSLATFTNSYQAWTSRRQADRGVAGRMLAGAAVGMPIGLLVYVVADDKTAHAHRVMVGSIHGDRTIILEGLEPNLTVVTDGHLRLVDGAKVNIIADRPAGELPASESGDTSERGGK